MYGAIFSVVWATFFVNGKHEKKKSPEEGGFALKRPICYAIPIARSVKNGVVATYTAFKRAKAGLKGVLSGMNTSRI
jgi:hypothetical protein